MEITEYNQDIYLKDCKQINELWDYLYNSKLNEEFYVEELLFLIQEIRQNPKIELLDALDKARFEWGLK
jgi:bifunctional N-acetylglucosamine-1-phosphate-uridyltransferase/glucosamine-1-phosphate-acetyltransferase GlmU-like protein